MNDRQFGVISQHFEVIARKLDALVLLSVMDMTAGKSQSEQIWLFSMTGMTPKQIAGIINTSPNTVRVALSNLRRIKKAARPDKVRR